MTIATTMVRRTDPDSENGSLRRLRLAVTLALTASLLAGPAWSQPRDGAGRAGNGPPHPAPASDAAHRSMEGFIERHAARLQLDEATVTRIRGVVDRSRSDNDGVRRKIEAAHTRMRSLLDVDVPDEDAVMNQADRIGSLYTQERKNRLRAMIAIRGMLTTEQRAELQKIRREMHESWGDKPPYGRGPYHGRPGWHGDRGPGRPE